MLRLVVLLCLCLGIVLLIAGRDRGQLRPGLAEAARTEVGATDESQPENAPTPAPRDIGQAEIVTEPVTPMVRAVPLSAGSGKGEILRTRSNRVNVRQGPSTNAVIVGQLEAGITVTVLDDSDSDWTEIEGGGLRGHVLARALTKEP